MNCMAILTEAESRKKQKVGEAAGAAVGRSWEGNEASDGVLPIALQHGSEPFGLESSTLTRTPNS
jgi:hypothetical protein